MTIRKQLVWLTVMIMIAEAILLQFDRQTTEPPVVVTQSIPKFYYNAPTVELPTSNCYATFATVRACENDRFIFVPEEAKEYVDAFESQWQLRLDSKFKIEALYISFVKDFNIESEDWGGRHIVGMCYYKQVPYVALLRSYWDRASDTERENLIFHELGHCLLKRNHLDERKNDKTVSIMNSRIMVPEEYNSKTREGYLEELFWRPPYDPRNGFCKGLYHRD
jgi:hypothetical protein